MSLASKLGTRGLAIGLVVVLLFSSVGAATAASAMNFGADAAHDDRIVVDVTKSSHPMDWGTSDAAATKYEANDGDVVEAEATVNRSMDVDDIGGGHVNPYQFTASDIEAAQFGAFPRVNDANNSASALDATEWTTSGATVSDTETAPNVEAVQITPSAAGDTASYGNWSSQLDSDESKRYLQLVVDVNSLGSATTVEIAAVDEDGDTKMAKIDAGATGEDVIANATGDGYVYQRQLGQIQTTGTGDGTFDNIESLQVTFAGGSNADITLAAVNLQKRGEWTLGEKRVDTDDEDDFETETIREVSTGGDVMIYDLSTLGSTFDSATIHDLTVPMEFRTSELEDDEDFSSTFMKADQYPGFEWKVETYARLSLPDAYDLSYSDAKLKSRVEVPSDRYMTVEYQEGVGDTDFEDIDSWTDVRTAYGSLDANVTHDETIQPGQEIVVHRVYKVTSDEKAALSNVGGGGGGFFGGASGGLKSVWGAIAGAVTAVTGLVANWYRKARKGV
jgi:hypothetical protein